MEEKSLREASWDQWVLFIGLAVFFVFLEMGMRFWEFITGTKFARVKEEE